MGDFNDETRTVSDPVATFHQETIPTYVPGPALKLPMFFEKRPYQGASGKLYPLPFTDKLGDIKQDCSYKVALLENEYIQIKVLPEKGGKVLQAYDKMRQYDFIYHNPVIKPAMIGIAGPWTNGGIEFNWPQHHRPTSVMPVEAWINTDVNGDKTVWVGEIEPFNRMKGMAGITICPGRSYMKMKARVFNRTALPQLFMWWSNMAVGRSRDYQIVFPPDVSSVNDHDRRAVIEWPIAKGVYQTARPFDFGSGTDLSKYPSIVVPSSYMVSQGQSDMNFTSGFDFSRNCGFVSVADHYVSPGKKLFHFGDYDFGNNWCANLMDDDIPYLEIMMGFYSDNQPDFTWIEPFETKCFEQYWYPIAGIGAVKNATIDAAVNLERQDEGLYLGFNVTGRFDGCQIKISAGHEVLFDDKADLAPDQIYSRLLPIRLNDDQEKSLSVALMDNQGRVLVQYQKLALKQHQPIIPRKPAAKPADIQTVDELYLNGLHLEQYKHFSYVPEHYYLEGLKRDAGDYRCNTAMGRVRLKQGCFQQAAAYFERAIERLTSRNTHPETVEAFYFLGLCHKYLGQTDAAYGALQRSTWQYGHASASYYALAEIDAFNDDLEAALAKLDQSMRTNSDNLKTLCLKAAILRHLRQYEAARAVALAARNLDSLDFWSRIELLLTCQADCDAAEARILTQEISDLFFNKPEYYLDVAVDYMAAGLYEDAMAVLNLADTAYPLVFYYIGACHSLIGHDKLAKACFQKADQIDPGYCFPSRLEDVAVLQLAIACYDQGAQALYYLGCLYYDRLRYEEAIAAWEQSLHLNPAFALVHRNLALAYFDKRGDHLAAREQMTEALRLDPVNARILYELQQILKNMSVSPSDRLALYTQYAQLVEERDDCYLDRIVLLTQLGDFDQAIEYAKNPNHRFHIYEGGEGQLARHHAWLYTLKGRDQLAAGERADAEQTLKQALVLHDNYGEGKSYFAQENHVWYTLGRLYEQAGRFQEMASADQAAAVDKRSLSEISLYRALALRKLNRFSEATDVLQNMLKAGQKMLDQPDVWPYFGVGSKTPPPFELDIVKTNTISGNLLKGFALLGLGQLDTAKQAVMPVRELSPHDFQLHLFDQLIYKGL